MKKTLLFLIAIVSFSLAQAQKCNAVFFNQGGQQFHVIVNGILQNVNPETNVKVTDLAFEGNYKVTIRFADNAIDNLTKSIYMMENNTEYSFEIKKNKKGKWVLRASSMVPIAQAPAPAPTQNVVTYSTTPPPTPEPAPSTAATTVTTETVTTSTTVNDNSTGNTENVNMDVNVGGVGMNVNVSVSDNGMNTNTNLNSSTSSTTTTTYTETTTLTTSGNMHDDGMSTEPVGEAVPIEEHYVMPGYNGPIGCPWPMSDADFEQAKKSIASKSFSDSKLTVAKQVTNANCLTAKQAKEIMLLFDFEDTKLDYAKYAYRHTYDIGNYYQLNDAFDFESSIEELNQYIESQK